MGGGSRSPHFLGRFMGEGSRSPHLTLITTYNRGLGQIMGEGSRSPHFYPCHHLAQRARPVRGGTEFTLSPYRTEGVVSLRKKGVGHHIFKLVTLKHIGLAQFLGEGSRSPHFLPGRHLAQRSWPVHCGGEKVTTCLTSLQLLHIRLHFKTCVDYTYNWNIFKLLIFADGVFCVLKRWERGK